MREYLLPVAIIAVIASIIVPLPPFILDLLLVANLVFALSLLILSLHVSEPLKLSCLPSLLLLATLFRLALNISTTRLILNTGNAGSTVEAFGSFVIQGNIAVGFIVFLIITFVQFLVIAKGAERVAEVSARFSLDAMPGRQMSIDADVRSGLYDLETARQKRQELQTESRFYGALDGAMKFIKGDAIAGIVIVFVNIIGGFVCGILLEGLDLRAAVAQYTILTIGDGLLSQIPSLLNSVSAGMIVTRVVRGDGISLALELLTQIGQLKRVHILCGIVSIVAGLLPGMPLVPFFLIGLFLLSRAILVSPARKHEENKAQQRFRPKTRPLLRIEFSSRLGRLLPPAAQIEAAFEDLRREVFEVHGLLIMPPEFSLSEKDDMSVSLFLRGVFADCMVFDEETPSVSVLTDWLKRFISGHCEELIDDISTRRLLDYFDSDFPELISAVIPSIASVTKLSEIFRKLASENVPFRNLDMVLQAIAENGLKAANDRVLLEDLRVAMKRVLCEKFITKGGELKAYSIDPLLDMCFVRAECERSPIDLEKVMLIVEQLESKANYEEAVLLASKKSRALIREYLSMKGIKTTVLAYDELIPELRVEILDTLGSNSPKKAEELFDALAA